MEQQLKLIANIDAGTDQITRDEVLFDRVSFKLNDQSDCEVYAVWNGRVGMERGMFFPTQGSADGYFVAITASRAARAAMNGSVRSEDAIKQKHAQEKTEWQKMLCGLPLSDTIIGMNRIKESASCPTENR